jgi:UMF1 family MFS transporter
MPLPAVHVDAPETVKPPSARLSIFGWVLFDWAAQPWFTLITTFIFAPYFANAIASDPVRGQALWGYATAAAGLIIAFCSPVLGAIADAGGGRKPWIAGFGTVLVAAAATLWLGKPGDPSTIAIVLIAFMCGTIANEFATVFNNAMMPGLVAPERLGRLSGAGWATGYVGGIISLVLMLCWIVADPTTGKTLIGAKPLFGLDAAAREGDRFAGPFTAIWFVLFTLPLFLFTPDRPRLLPIREATRQGLATLGDSVRWLRGQRDLARFLIANMIYSDGLVALFALGGIFAASVFGWTTIEIGIFGILLAATGTVGAYLGGMADDRFGPKAVVIGALIILILSLSAILTIGPDRVLFFSATPPRPGDGLFATVAERVYVAIGCCIGFAAGPLQAASRTLLARLAPATRVTQFFGLFALSGKMTSFMGPLAAALVTTLFASQYAGMAVLLVFFAAGLAVLSSVRVGARSTGSA